MSPYYADERVRIYHGDSRDVLPTLDSGGLLVADPPFDMWADLAGIVADFGSRSLAAFASYQHRHHIERRLGPPRVELVWTYRDGRWVSHLLPRLCHTSILIYGASGEAYVGDQVADRRPQRKGAGSVGRDVMATHIYRPRERKILNTVIEAPRTVADGVWAKPLAVVAPLVEWLTEPGGLVIDPFMGFGSVLTAARSLDRLYVGIEMDESRCEAAATQMQQESLW